jgi:hypothetical protein
MADDKKNLGAQDDARINLNESYEVQYWTKTLNVSKSELEEAVKKVGVSVKNVKAYLTDSNSQ